MDTPIDLLCPVCHHVLLKATPLRSDTKRAPAPGEPGMCRFCFALLQFVAPSEIADPLIIRAFPRIEAQRALPPEKYGRLIQAAIRDAMRYARQGAFVVMRWPWEEMEPAWIFLAARNIQLALCALIDGAVMPTLTRIRAPELLRVIDVLDETSAISSQELALMLERADLPSPIPTGADRPLGPADIVVDLFGQSEHVYRGRLHGRRVFETLAARPHPPVTDDEE